MKNSIRCGLVVSLLLLFASACSRPPVLPEETSLPKVVTPAVTATEIAAGGSHACVIRQGEVFCWGDNTFGQLGDGSYALRSTPVKVAGLENVVTISAGGSHTCGVTEQGEVKCWGNNGDGQLGDGTLDMSNLPVSVSGFVGKAVSVSAGDAHTCAITADGAAECWGKNIYGRLGDGTRSLRSKTPVSVVGLGGPVVSIGASSEHTCALLADGVVQCWGYNALGLLGIGEDKTLSATPVEVPGLEDGVGALAVGSSHTCALMQTGQVKCWGWLGPLGTSYIPIDVSGIPTATSLASGGEFSCAVTPSAGVVCWGDNEVGELGGGSTSGDLTAAQVVGLDSGVKVIATGFHFACALLDSGAVKCWGDNSAGQLGNNSTEDSPVPVEVTGWPE